MNERPVFSPPVLAALVAGVTAIFALSIVLMSRSDGGRAVVEPSSYSKSAIGHAGLYELLGRFGYGLDRSRVGAQRAPGEGGILVMAEPSPSSFGPSSILTLERTPSVLLVLPKREGLADRDKPIWIASAQTLPLPEVDRVLRFVVADGSVQRVEAPKSFAVNTIGLTPEFDQTAQLMRSESLKPLVGSEDGMLLGEADFDERLVWVLADPDIIENHGLGRGPNAAFILATLEAMRGSAPAGRIVFDEAIHGIAGPPSNPFRYLFEFPFVLVTVLVLAAVGLLLWATMGRFGGVQPAPPSFDLGKGRLIANTASLLERAGHHGFVMHRYVRMELREAGRALHAPAQLDDAALAEWLDRLGTARGVEESSAEILRRSDEGLDGGRSRLAGLFQAARDIHHWKDRIAHGSSARRHDR